MSRYAKRNGLIESTGTRQVMGHKVEGVLAGGKRMTITTFVYEWSIDIFIGTKSTYCVRAHLSKQADGTVDPSAFIDRVRWDAECSYDSPFERGKDTTMIFNLIITYIKDHYPDVQNVEFNDVSNRKCDNGGSVNLAAMKLFTDGETWYESHVKAKIDPRFETLYRTILADANRTKQNMSWEDAKRRVPWSAAGIAEEELKEQYETTDTWREWLRWIRTKKGDSAFCNWLSYSGWFDEFLRSVLKFNIMQFIYTIDINAIRMPYKLNGGGHTTRKRARSIL